MDPEKTYVLTEKKGRVGLLTLNWPEKRNTLSKEMLESLKKGIEVFEEDSEVCVVVLAANGSVFSSGHNLKELVGTGQKEVQAVFDLCTEVMEKIRHLSKPVIAQVQGLASAAGCQLVASCDLVVASTEASFQTPGVKIGLFCTTPSVPLSRDINPKKAMEMLLTGEAIVAEEAEKVGLVNRVVPNDKLGDETLALACQVSAYEPSAIALGKRAFYRQIALNESEAYRFAKGVMVENALKEEAQEGMKAFLEKRPPCWKK